MAEYFNRENVKRLLHIEYAYAAEQLLDEIPSDDVAPVVHGQWISKNTIGYDWTFVCSNCGYIDGYPFNDRHNFCPNCGAKMDGCDNTER